MKKYNILITKPAENDLREIGEYIANELREPFIAQNTVVSIAAAIEKLEKIPLRNALVLDEELAHKGFRKLLVDNYIIFYLVSEIHETVTIIRILYGKRDWKNLL